MKKGDKVKIYQKPFSKEGFEGKAILIRNVFSDLVDGTEGWLVRFDNGDEVRRVVKVE